MRTTSIFILFVCLTTGFSTSNGGSSQPSNLRLIAEDFRILSRVINAIYLQSAAIQKNIKAHDILSEILQIESSSLNDIVNVDVEAARVEINRMDTEWAKLGRKSTSTDPQDPKMHEGIVELAISYLMLFKILKHQNQLEILSNSMNISAIQFPAAAANLKNDPIFNHICFNIDHEALEVMVNRFSSAFNAFGAPYNKEAREIVDNYVGEAVKVMECISSLSKLRESVKNLKIRGLEESFEMVRQARMISTHFSNVAEDPFFPVIIHRSHNSLLESLPRRFEASKPMWGGDISKADHLKDVISALKNSVDYVQFYNQDYEEYNYVHTVGFVNSTDMIKVYEDLKSPWFRKNIAKGANTTNLSRAFRPFRMVSQKIIALETVWDRFAESAERELTGEVAESLGRILNVKQFAVNSSAKLQNLDHVQKSVKYCVDLRNESFDRSKFEQYEKQEQITTNVFGRIEKVYVHISELVDTLSETIGTKLTRSEKVIDVLKTLKDLTGMPVYWIPGTVSSLTNNMDVRLYEVIGNIAVLAKELKELKAASETIDEKQFVEMTDMATGLNIIDVVQCIRDRIQDDQFNEAFYVVDAYLSLLKFPKEDVVGRINKYLDTLLDVQIKMEDITVTVGKLRTKVIQNGTTDSFLALTDSRVFSENIGMCTGVLEEMDKALQHMDIFMDSDFEKPVRDAILDLGLPDWYYSDEDMQEFYDGILKADMIAGEVRNGSLLEVAKVFEQAAKVKGFHGTKAKLHELHEKLISHYNTRNTPAVKVFDAAQHLDLDFAKHHSRLQNARVTIINVQKYFDDLFGHTEHKTRTITIEKHIKPFISWQTILFICIGFVILVIMIILIVYGMTDKGRAHYKNLYIYYFGKHEDFEKRWRYSLFMDTIDEKNALLDAVREGNKPNLLKALKNGAYIDAYNKFGNTALHLATKFGFPDHVELLITYGADRSLLNSKNLIPIQMIPYDYENKFPQRIEKYEKIKAIYKKYEKKAFKICVPQAFPDSSFHIWMDEKIGEALADHFLEKFRAITSDEPIPTTTHVVFKTDKNGVLETDRLEALMWVFHGAIIVKEQWLTDCLNHAALIQRDMDYLIEKVKFKGVTYDCVLQWSEAMAKGSMPYLLGVFVAVVAPNNKNLVALSSIVTTQGGIFLNVFPAKELFNKGSHPYLHAHLGPLFLIHSGNEDLDVYRNDPDRMYTLFTEDEFIIFLLKRETNRDTRPNPPSVLIQEE
ncbi:unnamed protein product [Caenorhabditis brenneri]